MRIGIIAERTGVSRDTIRLYEQMGLLTGISRPHEYNNYKAYSEGHVERIHFILSLKKLGLTLKECKQVLQTIESDNYNKQFQFDFIGRKLSEIDQKIAELLKLKAQLTTFLENNCDQEEIVVKIQQTKGDKFS